MSSGGQCTPVSKRVHSYSLTCSGVSNVSNVIFNIIYESLDAILDSTPAPVWSVAYCSPDSSE